MENNMDYFRNYFEILNLIEIYMLLKINFMDFDLNINDLFVIKEDQFSYYFIIVKYS